MTKLPCDEKAESAKNSINFCTKVAVSNSIKNMPAVYKTTRMWANAQPDGHPAEHRWRPLFNAAVFG